MNLLLGLFGMIVYFVALQRIFKEIRENLKETIKELQDPNPFKGKSEAEKKIIDLFVRLEMQIQAIILITALIALWAWSLSEGCI